MTGLPQAKQRRTIAVAVGVVSGAVAVVVGVVVSGVDRCCRDEFHDQEPVLV